MLRLSLHTGECKRTNVNNMVGLGADRTANPLLVQTLDIVGAITTARSTAVPTLTPMPAGGLGEEISRVQICCAPGPTYILKVGDMPGPASV